MKTKQQPLYYQKRQRGSVLIVVLAVIFLMSMIIVRFLNETVEQLEYRALFDPAPSQRALAYSYLEAALAVVQEVGVIDNGNLYAPEQGWGNPLDYPGFPLPSGNVSIRIFDESALLPLHALDAETLRILFEEMELSTSVVRELTDSLLDWIDADSERRISGAETPDYLGERIPHRAADGPLQSFAELRLINGFREHFFDQETGQPNEFHRLFTANVSLRHTGAVNVNNAPELALRTLGRLGGWDPQYAWDGLEEPYLRSPPAGGSISLAAATSTLLRVEIELQTGTSPFRITAFVVPRLNTATEAGDENLPGRTPSDRVRRTGATDEQDAIRYPFQIIKLTENTDLGATSSTALRYSVIDSRALFSPR